MLTQTGPRTNTMLPSFAFVRLPMSTFETTARRRPATVLLPHPSLADMLDTIKRSDPIRYAAILEVTTQAYQQVQAERRKASPAPVTPW